VTAMARLVNGPEDQPCDAPVQWDRIGWRAQEEHIRRLRQRIFTAAQEQDWPRVRNLQKLMPRSRACTLVSVRQVTQRNTGRKTAGIHGNTRADSRCHTSTAARSRRRGRRACRHRHGRGNHPARRLPLERRLRPGARADRGPGTRLASLPARRSGWSKGAPVLIVDARDITIAVVQGVGTRGAAGRRLTAG